MDNSFEKTIKHLPTPHRFPLDTFCLAGFIDCGLLELHLLVLSLTSPCEFRKPPYYRWISPFSDVRWAALLLAIIIMYSNVSARIVAPNHVLNLPWITRLLFGHPYLLSTVHPSQLCSSCYRLTLLQETCLSLSDFPNLLIQHLRLRRSYQKTTNRHLFPSVDDTRTTFVPISVSSPFHSAYQLTLRLRLE